MPPNAYTGLREGGNIQSGGFVHDHTLGLAGCGHLSPFDSFAEPTTITTSPVITRSCGPADWPTSDDGTWASAVSVASPRFLETVAGRYTDS